MAGPCTQRLMTFLKCKKEKKKKAALLGVGRADRPTHQGPLQPQLSQRPTAMPWAEHPPIRPNSSLIRGRNFPLRN